MSEFYRTEHEIEDLRSALHKLVQNKQGNVTDPEVMALSAKLDHLIVAFERTKANHPVKKWVRRE